MNIEIIQNIISKIPTADQIANTEVSFELGVGTIAVVVILLIIMPALIFSFVIHEHIGN